MPAMKVHATTLPLDVLDVVLALAPDFTTLMAAVMTCKTFHRAYLGRSVGILRDVATQSYNGRVELVHEAIRAIRVETDILYLNRWAKCDQARFTSVLGAQFNDDALRSRSLTKYEAKELCKRVEDANALEVIFCTRKKDGLTGDTSRLSGNESKRFHFAVHRLEMLLSLCRRPHAGTRQWVDFESRKELFYQRFSDEEVYHLWELKQFLVKCVQEAAMHLSLASAWKTDQLHHVAIGLGTRNIMRIIRDPHTFKLPQRRYSLKTYYEPDFFRYIWTGKVPTTSVPGIRAIVFEADKENIRCQMCRNCEGAALWNVTNWHKLPSYFSLKNLPNFLPKKLAKNEHELAQLSAHLGISFNDPDTPTADKAVQDANVVMKDILSALFMFKLDKPHVTPQTRMCATCLDEYITTRVWLWWAFAKGETNLDCQFGHHCSDQSRRRGHRQAFNHACPNNHNARKALKTAVGQALTAGRSIDGITDELDAKVVVQIAWRTDLDPEQNARKKDKEFFRKYYRNSQQILWAVQKCERTFLAEKKALFEKNTGKNTGLSTMPAP